MRIDLGRWTEEELDWLLREAAGLTDIPSRISFLSGRFFGVPYQANTLIGSSEIPEELVLDLSGVDCFTLLDYVEAMRRSSSFDQFVEALRLVRYQGGAVGFGTRNHFFTDWAAYNGGFIRDITPDVGGGSTEQARKTLNRKKDSTLYLPGIPEAPKEIAFIPAGKMTGIVFESLRTGDYLGIFAEDEGLDVTHVGIVIKERDVFLRHASSDANMRRVVDSPLEEYLSGKPGIIVLRPVA